MTLDYSAQYAKFNPDSPEHRHGLTLLHQRMLAPLLPADRGAAILDVGCGRGYALQDLRALGYTKLAGVEIDAGQAIFAQQQGLDVTLAARTEDFLAPRSAAYATVLLMDVLEHVPRASQPDFLRAVSRSLVPGGRLICSVPNAASAIASYWLHNDYTHHASFTADSLSFVLGQCGFARVQCSAVEFFPRPRYLFWLPSKRSVAWWLRCYHRAWRRTAFIAELGWDAGRRVILTPNLLAVAETPKA